MIRRLVREVYSGWNDDDVPRLGAALAFYTVFSLAPILIVAIAVAGLIVGRTQAEDHLISQIEQLIGTTSAEAVRAMIVASGKPSTGIMSSIIGIVTLFVGATGALVELQDGLNRVWKVRTPSFVGFKGLLRQRLTSLALLSGIAFLLLVSLVISAVLSAIGTLVSSRMLELFFSWVVITGLFATIFKTMPDLRVEWADVWIGAAVTGALFTLGKYLVGLYLGKGALSSTYGAAGSFVAILIWVYYSAIILYVGAEFTKGYSHHCGSRKERLPAQEKASTK